MIKDDGMVIHFNNPKVQASLSANTFAVTGHAETMPLTELLPGILTQLGSDSLSNLRQLAQRFPGPRQGTYGAHARETPCIAPCSALGLIPYRDWVESMHFLMVVYHGKYFTIDPPPPLSGIY